jgi:5'-nucleotidase
MLVIALSTRALFSLEKENEIYQNEGQAAFDQYQLDNEKVPLQPGVAFPLVKKMLALNKLGHGKLVEVTLLSRNSPEAGLRVRHSIQEYGLDIERAIFTQGLERFRFLKALGAHLFLSANVDDVRGAIQNHVAAAVMLPDSVFTLDSRDDIRIAFDGDSVLFSDEAERVNHEQGLEKFQAHEILHAERPLPPGPFKGLLEELKALQSKFPAGQCPIKTALVTARDIQTQVRPMRTLRSWGVSLNAAIWCGGLPKGPFLDAWETDMFFDDTPKNCDSARQHVSTGLVPNGVVHEHKTATPDGASAQPQAPETAATAA